LLKHLHAVLREEENIGIGMGAEHSLRWEILIAGDSARNTANAEVVSKVAAMQISAEICWPKQSFLMCFSFPGS
jgi:hypothetical protein